ncbi:MAG: RNA polymerase sigma factor [Flavipsychrobacter sp.]|nr:RNA polymerase sigma factor [Flavipsychrobacter sp.]
MLPEELLKQVAAGNEKAFRQLYELFSDRVYQSCLLYMQNEAEAEEALQDIFLQVYQSAASFKGGSTVQTWIYRIAVNKCLDKLRYKKRVKRFAFISSLIHRETGELLHDPGDFQHPGVLLENKDKSAHLFRALRELPENQHAVFVLKQLEGMPQKEIAQVLNVSEKAVESLFQRAKAKLRAVLSEFYNQSKD